MVSSFPEAFAGEYDKIRQAHAKYLASFKVSMPQYGSAQSLWLIYMVRHLGKLVAKEDISAFVIKYLPKLGGDQQVRHLKGGGWHLLLSGKANDFLPHNASYIKSGQTVALKKGDKIPNGFYMLVDITSVSPDYAPDKRDGSLNKLTWAEKVEAYSGCCAVCGKKRKLEQGHKDPTLGYTPENIIPMCQQCNNWASKDVVLNSEGRVVALASDKLVRKSSPAIQQKIYIWLKKIFKENQS